MPQATKKTLEEQLDVLIAKAPALRQVGVVNLELDGGRISSATFAPMEPELPVLTGGRRDEYDEVDPMEDPRTYGLPEGTQLGWSLLRDEDEEEGARI